MSYQITVKSYQRVFRRPLRTAHGEWALREGFIVRVEQEGQIGYGEVAPIPDFGSETLAEAAEFLGELTQQAELEVPAELPCCAFALSAACAATETVQTTDLRNYPVSALLPAGKAGLPRANERLHAGYQNMKWKIGVAPIQHELSLAQRLLETLPTGHSVRFDANASLSPSELAQWLDLLKRFPQQTDYIEQALPCGQETVMAQAMQDSGVLIALDESLNGDNGNRWLKPGAWPGPLVIKAPLMGDVVQLAAQLKPVADQVVFSSVFETRIGLENSLRLADQLPRLSRPIGFDTVDAFDDALQSIKPCANIHPIDRQNYEPELIWNSI